MADQIGAVRCGTCRLAVLPQHKEGHKCVSRWQREKSKKRNLAKGLEAKGHDRPKKTVAKERSLKQGSKLGSEDTVLEGGQTSAAFSGSEPRPKRRRADEESSFASAPASPGKNAPAAPPTQTEEGLSPEEEEDVTEAEAKGEEDKAVLMTRIKTVDLMPKCPWCKERFRSVEDLHQHATTAHRKGKVSTRSVLPSEKISSFCRSYLT